MLHTRGALIKNWRHRIANAHAFARSHVAVVYGVFLVYGLGVKTRSSKVSPKMPSHELPKGPLARLLPALFPMQSGDKISVDSRERVLKCYGGKKNAWPSCQLLHVTVHYFPVNDGYNVARYAACAALAAAWLLAYPSGARARSLAAALIYSIIEFTFTFGERGKPYTSAAQFAANLVYTPVLLDVYGSVILDGGYHPLWYVLLFPLNIWVLEVVEGTAIMAFYQGFNVAWAYTDYRDSHCRGLVRAGHAWWWFGLGATCWVLETQTPFGELRGKP